MSGWDSVPDSKPSPAKSGWDAVPDTAVSDGFQPTRYGFKVKPAVVNGVQTVEREDGAAWFGPEQGNKGAAGWFNRKGQRVGLKSGVGTMQEESFANPMDVMGQGATDLPVKVAQTGAHLVGSSAVDPYVSRREQEFRDQYGDSFDVNALRTAGSLVATQGAGKLLGVALEGAQVPGMVSKGVDSLAKLRSYLTALKGGEYIVPLAEQVVKGAAIAPAFTPDAGVKDNSDFWNRQLEEAKTGAKIGAALHGGSTIAQEVFPAVGQRMRRVFGTKAEREAALARAQEMRSATISEQFPKGAEPSLGESLQSPTIKRIENANEYIPFSGAGKQLETKNAALTAAVREKAQASAPALGSTGAGTEIAESAQRELANIKADIKPMYDQVREKVSGIQAANGKTIAAYDDAIMKESGLSGPKSPQVKALRAEKDAIVRGETGKTFEDLEAMQDRNQSEAASGAANNDKLARDLGRYRSKIAKANGEDMHATIAKADPSGQASELYKQANKRWADEVIPKEPNQSPSWEGYRKEARVLHGRDEFQGKIAPSILQGDSPDMARYVKNSLDSKGHEAVRAEILRRVDEAMTNTKGQIPSPKMAANAIGEHSNFIKVFFSPLEQKQLIGLKNALSEMQRSGQYMEQLTTGKFVPAMAAVSELGASVPLALAGHPGAMVGATGVSGVSRLFTRLSGTQAGKDWLLKVSSSKPGTRVMSGLMQELPAIVALKNVNPFKPDPIADPLVAQKDNQ